jgi:heme/copper-type cytochrome/quinol oxidase subunit 2
MLIKRTTALTALSLLGAHLATAQTTASASAPTSADMLFWLLGGILGIVLIVVLVTGATMASATHQHFRQARNNAANKSFTQDKEQKGVTSW